MSKRSRVLVGAVALAAIAAGDQALAYTIIPFMPGAPGLQNNTQIASPGYPDFWSENGSATLSQAPHGGNFTFTYTDVYNPKSCSSCAAVFNFPSAAFAVSNLDLVLTATFAPSGAFVSGNYSIVGGLPAGSPPGYSWGSTGTTPITLFSASLTGANVNLTTDALGFKTSTFGGWANQPQFTGGITSESVWLYSQLTCQTGNQSAPLCSSQKTGPGSLWTSFLQQLKNDNLNVTGKFTGLASIATVPIPGALLLFGSGLAGLGVLRRRRAPAIAAA